jgi:hypothetical protein
MEKTCSNCKHSFYFDDNNTYYKSCAKTHEIILAPAKCCCIWYENDRDKK